MSKWGCVVNTSRINKSIHQLFFIGNKYTNLISKLSNLIEKQTKSIYAYLLTNNILLYTERGRQRQDLVGNG